MSDAGGLINLRSLRLTDFRSYAAIEFRPASRIVALQGPNGSGKTNLLEAISLLAPGRGLRGAKFAELSRRAPGASGGWAVAAHLTGTQGSLTLGTGIDAAQAERRKILLDGDPVTAATAAEHFACVWLTPQMDRLFTEGASARRRFLDRLTLALAPGHASEVAAFEAAAANRNRLIEQGGYDPVWLTTIEDSMARHAAAMTAARLDLIARLNVTLACGAFAPFPSATLTLECSIGARLSAEPALAVEDWLRRLYARTRHETLAAVSPQRADLVLADQATGLVASLASTGQQRTMLVAIVLAHADLVTTLRGAAPILLLDEPFVHLDAPHRAALSAALASRSAQIFCTATDREHLAALGPDAAVWNVSPGAVRAA
ncbi:MAG: DNA replication/repair protein RecF [Acidiphilium sp.]|nr:DNA replication/repair protein RecF [Acidiphilium sp.]MDD4935735.1 DNA replication/repair protein RecF [Acidiphilium sp.]